MTAARNALLHRIWRGHDPFDGFPQSWQETDPQGWRSQHHYLSEGIEEIAPKLVVEVGVWKGASVITLASQMKAKAIDGVVVAVDTWLGSSEHWLKDKGFAHLRVQHGFPTLHRTFMANILARGLQDYVLPLPLDSLNAAKFVAELSLSIDLLHLDGAHDFQSVSADLRVWWPLIRPGGMLIGDDYTRAWPGVVRAFRRLSKRQDVLLEASTGKCRLRKPLAALASVSR